MAPRALNLLTQCHYRAVCSALVAFDNPEPHLSQKQVPAICCFWHMPVSPQLEG